MKSFFFRLLFLLLLFFYTKAFCADTSKVFLLDYSVLAKTKIRIKNNDPQLVIAYKQLIKDADAALQVAPMSVMEKKINPPSGDRHDYMSLAPYFWPDPTKEDGLPYIRKDGQINPEVQEYKDKEYIPVLCRLINTLALAYYFSDDVKYAEKSTNMIKVWFLDAETKMNPNLNFGQAVKGVNEGRGEGIIDTRFFMKVVDAIGLLQGSKCWTNNNQKEMKIWFANYLSWLATSKNGKDEQKAKNNHGIWYDAQSLSFALFVGDVASAKEIIYRVQKRIDTQMDDEGFFPAEMKRTISLHYSVFVLDPLFNIAQMSSLLGIDMWNYTSPSGKSIRKAFIALEPFITKSKDWEGEQIKPFEFQAAVPILAQAISKYECRSCSSGIKVIFGEKAEKSVVNLIYNFD